MIKMFSKSCFKYFTRFMETSSTTLRSTIYAEPLKNRGLIRIQGPNVFQFLQGLITNDMANINDKNSLYTLFLNGSGRLLYDSIIYATPEKNTYFIECDKVISSELRRHLRVHRIRQKLEIDSIENELTPWVIFNTNNFPICDIITEKNQIDKKSILVSKDPRLPNLGLRIIVPQSFELSNLQNLLVSKSINGSVGDHNYQNHRYNLGVGEGVVDHPPGKSFPFEANVDFLNGVSFRKGCYLGQELTARVHHTGVIRKRLMPLILTKPVESGVTNVQTESGNIVGTIRGCLNNRALGLIRIEHVIKVPNLMIDGNLCKATIPDWWDKNLLNLQN